MMNPVSTLEGAGAVIGALYPTTHFLTLSNGTFSKALGFSALGGSLAAGAAGSAGADRQWWCAAAQAGEIEGTMRLNLELLRHLVSGLKEFRSLAGDKAMLFLIIFMFTGAVYSDHLRPESLLRAAVAVVDEDQSQLSERIIAAAAPAAVHRAGARQPR